MYKDYLDAIIKYYSVKRENSLLPQGLLNPSPRKLRNECVLVYNSGFNKKDQGILKSFFLINSEIDISRTIGKYDLDKFRPLVNYLKGITNATEDKNIELLGWLLDYPNRPFDARFNYTDDEKQEPVNSPGAGIETTNELDVINIPDEEIETEVSNTNITFANTNGLVNPGNKRRGLMAGVIILLGTGLWFSLNKINNSTFGLAAQAYKECMYWADDHYEAVSCDSTSGLGLVEGLDKRRLENLRRIKSPDTIAEKHIGRFYYQKRGGDSLEYYTDGGRDPIDPNRDLHRLTRYIFDKYLRKKAD
ncbi:MAG: hypothetical protein ABWZ25_11490 [Chitinophagaceae bacterium]